MKNLIVRCNYVESLLVNVILLDAVKRRSGGVHGDPAGKIAQRPWGERSFYIEDPFGNKICFVDRSTVYTGPT